MDRSTIFDPFYPAHPARLQWFKMQSSGAGLIDGDTSGPDNRLPVGGSDPGIGAWEEPTDANGEAKHTLTVSMQPGNNYRAGASCMDDGVTETNITQTEADVNVPTPPVVLTDMLTIWRKVWLELDSMGPGTDISRTGAIDAIADNLPHPGDGRFEFNVSDIDDDARFEGGTASVAATGRVYALIDNEQATGDDYYFTDGLIVGNDLDQTAAVVDDDAFTLPHTPYADITILNSKYRPCYAEFGEDDTARDATNTFIATVPSDQQSIPTIILPACQQNQDRHPAPDLWTALILSAYQSYDENDNPSGNVSTVDLDPDFWYHIHGPPPATSWEVGDTSSTFGLTPVSASPVVNCTLVLNEHIRDYVAQLQQLGDYGPVWGPHPRGQTHEFIEPRVIAHEIAHQFGIVGHQAATLVNGWEGDDAEFSASQIDLIRNSTHLAEE